MNTEKYSDFVEQVWVGGKNGKDADTQLAIAALGLVGEAGEVTEHIKKYLRGTHKLNVEEIELELGDVLYYIHKIANHLGLNVKIIRNKNVKKLSERYLEKHGKPVEYGDQ